MYNHDNRGNILTVRKPGVMFRQYACDEAKRYRSRRGCQFFEKSENGIKFSAIFYTDSRST